MEAVTLEWLILLKILLLFISIFTTFTNAMAFVKWGHGEDMEKIPVVLWAFSITGFLVIQFKLYLP
jgi:hypothetical protein